MNVTDKIRSLKHDVEFKTKRIEELKFEIEIAETMLRSLEPEHQAQLEALGVNGKEPF